MRRTRLLIGLIAFIPIASVSGQETTPVPFGDLIAAASEQMATDCERMLDAQASATELAKREAEMGAAVLCDCMPLAVEALGRTRGPQTLVSGAEFAALLLPELDRCGAQAVRDTARRDCAKLTPPNAPPTYCTCFTSAVDALTDEEIVDDSIASRDNLEQRVQARRNSTPELPLYDTLLARIDRQCRLAPPTR
jgi:hypothetical protein